jgi:HSP20 family protein
MLDDVFAMPSVEKRMFPPSSEPLPDPVWAPRTDISKGPDAYLICLDLPGVPKDNVELKLEGNRLIIQGERSEHIRQTGHQRIRVECQRGAFRRVLRLPEDANAQAIEATYEHGVLYITVPLADPRPPQDIDIT